MRVSRDGTLALLDLALIPSRIYELILHNFIQGAATADIGCGTGRDTHWLTHNAYQTIDALMPQIFPYLQKPLAYPPI